MERIISLLILAGLWVLPASLNAQSPAQVDQDFDAFGYDGVIEPGMTLCVEVYAGAVGGKDGVKLEDQVLITEDGYENLTTYPFEDIFL